MKPIRFLGDSRDAVYVLHAFQKKARSTAKTDIETAQRRYAELMRGER